MTINETVLFGSFRQECGRHFGRILTEDDERKNL